MNERARMYLEELLADYPVLGPLRGQIEKAFALLNMGFRGGGRLYICGNGGSAADALHIVGELMKSFTVSRPVDPGIAKALHIAYAEDAKGLIDNLQKALPAQALVGNVSLETAYANDVADEYAFAQQLYGYGRAGDMLLGISTSGNAKNVTAAVRLARCMGITTIALTGGDGGLLGRLCDAAVIVPSAVTYKIQELHLPIYHALCRMLEASFFTLEITDKVES